MKQAGKSIDQFMTDFLFLFLTGAAIGWLYEVGLHIVQDGCFVNRGMLHGPWLPIYGVGCLMMVGLKKMIKKNHFTYFAVSTVACGVIEYTTSWLLEIVYHTRWWDYSDFALNLHGRIFIGGLLGFGLMGCLFVYGLLPLLTKQYRKIPAWVQKGISSSVLSVFVVLLLLIPFVKGLHD